MSEEHKTIRININATEQEIEAAIEAAVAYELENGQMSALNVEFVHGESEGVNITSAGKFTREEKIPVDDFDEFMDMVKDVEFTGDLSADLDTVTKLYESQENQTCTGQNCKANYSYSEGTRLTGCTFKMVRKAVKKGALAMRSDGSKITFLTQEDIEADDWIIIW
jgi:hypothetical protein